jgi:uncharacterized protein YjiS (DUF1127 family)
MHHSLVIAFDAVKPERAGLRAGSILGRLGAWIRNWFHRQSVLAELAELDQRTLDDLRISPGDFQAIADGSFKREPAWGNPPVALDLAKLARRTAERPYQYYL